MRKIRSIEVKARDIPQDFLKKLGSHISQVGGLYVHTPAQLKKKSKTYLVKQVLRLEKLIVIITYNAYKMQLPRLRTTRPKYYKFGSGKRLPRDYETLSMTTGRLTYKKKPKTKRKFSRKQLAAQRLFAKRARAGTLRK